MLRRFTTEDFFAAITALEREATYRADIASHATTELQQERDTTLMLRCRIAGLLAENKRLQDENERLTFDCGVLRGQDASDMYCRIKELEAEVYRLTSTHYAQEAQVQ